jgi:hypothetical protein
VLTYDAGAWVAKPAPSGGGGGGGVMSGTGSPHGVVNAPAKGTIYNDTAATDARTQWIALATGTGHWARLYDDVHAKGFCTVIDGATDNGTDLQAADVAAASVGAALYLDPLGTYFLQNDYLFTAPVKIPYGARIKRSATAHVQFAKGVIAGDYWIFDNTARGTGRFDFTPGFIETYRFKWWNVIGNNYSRDESAEFQDMEDQLPNGAEVRATPGQLIRVDYRVRQCAWGQTHEAPTNHLDPSQPSVQIKYGNASVDSGIMLNLDRAGFATWKGFLFDQQNADTAVNFEMSTVDGVAGNDIIQAIGETYPAIPWTFAPFDVGKRISISQMGPGGNRYEGVITEFIDSPIFYAQGSQVRVSPPIATSWTRRSFAINPGPYQQCENISTQCTFIGCNWNMWYVRDVTDVQGVCLARTSGSNGELHRFHDCTWLGFDRINAYGYRIYNNGGITASMTAGSNVVTLSGTPTGQGVIDATKVGRMFRIGRAGTTTAAPLTVVAPGAAAGDTSIPVAATTQFIPLGGTVRLNGFFMSVTADVPVGSTSLPMGLVGAAVPAGWTGDDCGDMRAAPDKGAGQLQCTITSVIDDHTFTVNTNALHDVSGMMCLIDRNRGRGFFIGPSFNVHMIAFSGSCNFQSLYRGIVCFGGGFHAESVINIGACDANIEIGGNNAHPMCLGFINSENSLQHLINNTGQPLEIRGRFACERAAPGKGVCQLYQGNSGGLDVSTSLFTGLDTYAKTGGSTYWDIHYTAGMTIIARNVLAMDIDNQLIDPQRCGIEGNVNNQCLIKFENAFNYQSKVWGNAFSESPVIRLGGSVHFGPPQLGGPANLAFGEFAFRWPPNGPGMLVDSWFSGGLKTAAIRPRSVRVLNDAGSGSTINPGEGLQPDDYGIEVTLNAFTDRYLTLFSTGSLALPVAWECTFVRLDANPTHFDIQCGDAGNTINGLASYRLDGVNNVVRLFHMGSGVFVAK